MPDRSSPPALFHPGERALQRSVGARGQVEAVGRRLVRDHLPESHRTFFAQLPFLVVGAVDPRGDVWASVLAEPPGLATSPDPYTLQIAAEPEPADPIRAGLGEGRAVGLLGIELQTRRRNRANGRIVHRGPGLRVAVEHSFGNCPRYIQRHELWRVDAQPQPPIWSDGLSDAGRALIARAHTSFVASYAERGHGRQVDVSHRGGRPGFVHTGEHGLLTVPDFAGNRFFNTLGNFLINPRAGLLFWDLEAGDVLQLTGEAALIFGGPRLEAFEGAQRLWTFTCRRSVLRRGALGLRGRLLQPSPHSEQTGSWAQVAERVRS